MARFRDLYLTTHNTHERHISMLYINHQLLCTDYYLFIKYYSPLHVSSLKCSSSGGCSCTHAAYGTVTLYESSWWLVGTQLEWRLTLQDRASPVIEQVIYFHDHALIIILIIITTVFYIIIRIIQNKQTRRFVLEGQMIEIIWQSFFTQACTYKPPGAFIESDSTICCMCTTVSSWRWALEARNM